jgi:hypothetical protein
MNVLVQLKSAFRNKNIVQNVLLCLCVIIVMHLLYGVYRSSTTLQEGVRRGKTNNCSKKTLRKCKRRFKKNCIKLHNKVNKRKWRKTCTVKTMKNCLRQYKRGCDRKRRGSTAVEKPPAKPPADPDPTPPVATDDTPVDTPTPPDPDETTALKEKIEKLHTDLVDSLQDYSVKIPSLNEAFLTLDTDIGTKTPELLNNVNGLLLGMANKESKLGIILRKLKIDIISLQENDLPNLAVLIDPNAIEQKITDINNAKNTVGTTADLKKTFESATLLELNSIYYRLESYFSFWESLQTYYTAGDEMITDLTENLAKYENQLDAGGDDWIGSVANLGIVDGCIDPTAFNYDWTANTDDSSCKPVINGCMNDKFTEYKPTANTDDGSCATENVYGCTDDTAINYDKTANTDDGSCATEIVDGCMDKKAFNYDETANTNDGCLFIPEEDERPIQQPNFVFNLGGDDNEKYANIDFLFEDQPVGSYFIDVKYPAPDDATWFTLYVKSPTKKDATEHHIDEFWFVHKYKYPNKLYLNRVFISGDLCMGGGITEPACQSDKGDIWFTENIGYEYNQCADKIGGGTPVDLPGCGFKITDTNTVIDGINFFMPALRKTPKLIDWHVHGNKPDLTIGEAVTRTGLLDSNKLAARNIKVWRGYWIGGATASIAPM